MRAIELFAGIGGFRIALDRIGVETVWANEIDPQAAAIYRSNFKDANLRVGDIRAIQTSDIPHADIITAGFPCQPFSSAGKKKGINCENNGNLFQDIIRILKDKQPQYFILENVKRILSMESGFHFKTILKELSRLDYVIEWRLLDASNLGMAQTRQRVFIVGHLANPAVELDRLSVLTVKTDDVLRRYGKMSFSKLSRPIEYSSSKVKTWGICHAGRMFTETVGDLNTGEPVKKLKQILQNPTEVDPLFDFTADTLVRIQNSDFVNRYYNGVQILWNQEGGARFGYTVFGTDGIASTLTASTSRHYERYKVGNLFRRLTNIEYARLMGFPDNWCRIASRYDQYSMYGNAVVPKCVEWAARRLLRIDHAVDRLDHRQFALTE